MANEPESGRCARCRELTVLEWVACETCEGSGEVYANQYTSTNTKVCPDCCDGGGGEWLTPCCGRGLADEAADVDAAYERYREQGGAL